MLEGGDPVVAGTGLSAGFPAERTLEIVLLAMLVATMILHVS